MNIFKRRNPLEFTERFKIYLNCKEYLTEIKWEPACRCHKCGIGSYQIRKDNSCSETGSLPQTPYSNVLILGSGLLFFILKWLQV